MRPNLLPKGGDATQPASVKPVPPIASKLSHSLRESIGKRSGRISAACQACKKRKARCSGGPPPCANCRAAGTACVIDVGLDGRRKASTHRLQEELSRHRYVLHTALQAVKEHGGEQREAILERLRQLPETIEVAEATDIDSSPVEEQDRSTLPSDITFTLSQGESSTPSETDSNATQTWQEARHALCRYETLLTVLLNASSDDVEKILSQLRWMGGRPLAPTRSIEALIEYPENIEVLPSAELAKIIKTFLKIYDRETQENNNGREWQQSPPPRGPFNNNSVLKIPEHALYQCLNSWFQQAQLVPALFGDFARELDDHVAIIGITQGWTLLRQNITLCPQWEIIAQWDEQAHQVLRLIDRIAYVSLLRRGLKYCSAPDPTIEEICDTIPDYLRPLPEQTSAMFGNIVQYIPWPGIRSMMLSKPEAFTYNEFWRRYLSSVRFLWPWDINEAFQDHPSRTMLSFSPTFLTAFDDVNSWTLTKDFLDRYPDFRAEVNEFEA